MLLDDFEEYLTANALIEDYLLYVDGFRDAGDYAVCLFEYGSNNGPKGIISGTRQIQVAVRAPGAEEAALKALELHTHFDQFTDERLSLTTDRWVVLYVRGTPIKLKEDEEGRFVYVFNMACTTTKL